MTASEHRHFTSLLPSASSALSPVPTDPWYGAIPRNTFRGPVPAAWCSQKQPYICDLRGVNSLYLPAACNASTWCGLTHDSSVVNGHWSEWTQVCSKSCGGGNYTRSCSNPARENGGKDCHGIDSQPCNTQPCPGTNTHLHHCLNENGVEKVLPH